MIRAIIGVAICFVVCLIVGPWLLQILLAPLRRSLAAHDGGQIVADGPMARLAAYFQISMVGFNLGAGLQHQIAVSRWATFAIGFPIGFGAAFELPLAMLVLAKIGIGSVEGFKRHRRAAILVCAVASAALTPSPSPVDMMLMMVPLMLLYEGGIYLVRLNARRRLQVEPTRDATDDADNLFAHFLLPRTLLSVAAIQPFDAARGGPRAQWCPHSNGWNRLQADCILEPNERSQENLSIEQWDPQAAEQLFPVVYDELRRLAAARPAREPDGHKLQICLVY